MELELTRQSICLQKDLLCDNFEQAVDCEFTLPDYCPDIMRILKCAIEAKILTSSVSGNTLSIDGVANVRVLYLGGEDRELRGYEVPVSFSKNIDVQGDSGRANAVVSAKCDYVNCRAVNERKIDVHGAVSLKVCITTPMDVELITDANGCGIQKKMQTVEYEEPVGSVQKQFLLNGDVELGSASGSLQHIVRYDTRADIDECRIIANKAIIKGNVMLSVLYGSDNGYEHISQNIPFNQIIEMFGVDDECDVDVGMDVSTCDIKPITGADGKCKTLSTSMKLNLMLNGLKKGSVSTLADAYSTDYNTNKDHFNFKTSCEKAKLKETIVVKDTAQLPDNSTQILNMWCGEPNVTYMIEDDSVAIKGNVTVCMIIKTDDGTCNYIESKLNIDQQYDAQGADSIRNSKLNVRNCSYTLTGDDSAEIKVELFFEASLSDTNECKTINQLEIDENDKKDSNQPALTVYFASAGEDLWDIAMSYNTDIQAIMQINELQTDTLQNDIPLLIPSVMS